MNEEGKNGPSQGSWVGACRYCEGDTFAYDFTILSCFRSALVLSSFENVLLDCPAGAQIPDPLVYQHGRDPLILHHPLHRC